VEPMPLVERWGADTMRLNILFAGPFEDDIDWKLIAPDPHRRPGVTTWLGRGFAAGGRPLERRPPDPEPLRRLSPRAARARPAGPRARRRGRPPGPGAVAAPDPPDDPGGHRRHGALPVQRGDQ